MPHLPALRCLPGREHTIENSHERGQLEGGFTLKTKDDELVLFNEVKNQERDNFLIHASDDFEDSLSKLRHLSDFKLGINIPARGETSELLNLEGDKNDYDWLLTPPDTPLFSKLDDDDDYQPVILPHRGRTKSQPIPISRSLSDKSYRTSRTSYSPQRLSPSPQSNDAIRQLRWRSSSATQSIPYSVIRSTAPTRSPYSPPNKQPSLIPRSSSPVLARTSTSSIIHASSYGGRGASPANASHGTPSSPKLQGWQKTIPGFNSVAPPNPRISLSDPSASHARASNTVSRNGRELSLKLGRKSMSPTSSRCISTSHSPENHKGFVSSCGDDIEESLHSRATGVSRSPLPRKDGAQANNKAMSFSRKQCRNLPSDPIPNKSFDSSLRLMNQRRAPKSMFRPLLSSVPTSTFRPIYSRNSSLTTSSNTSSEPGVISVALDLEDNEIEQIVLPDGWDRTEGFDTDEFDKTDEVIRDTSNEASSGKHQALDEGFTGILKERFNSEDVQNAIVNLGDQCVIDGYARMPFCSKCGKEFGINETTGNQNLCEKCAEEDRFSTAESAFFSIPSIESVPSHVDTAIWVSQEPHLHDGKPEFLEDDNQKFTLGQHERNIERGAEDMPNNVFMQSVDKKESQFSEQRLDLKVDVPKCTGISVLLLQGSANTKWPILHEKTLTATSILCSEPSYSRNTSNTSRRSIIVDSASATSSIDLGLSRQTEAYVQHQLSRKNALCVQRNLDGNAQSISSDDDASTNIYEPRSLRNEFDEIFSSSTDCLKCKSSRDMTVVSEDHTDSLDQSHLDFTPSSRTVISEECTSVYADNCRADSASATSSIDLGLSRQTEAYVQHKLSRKNDALCIKRNLVGIAQSISSDNDASTNTYEPRSLRNEFDEIFCSSTECLKCKSSRDMTVVSEDHTDSLDQSHLYFTPSSRTVISEECTSVYAGNCRADSASTTSSIDLGLSRQTEAYVQHLLSRKNDALCIKRNFDGNAQSISSDNDASTNTYEPRSLRNEYDEIFSSSTECLKCKSSRDMAVVSEVHNDSLYQSHLDFTPSSRAVISEECTSVYADNCRTVSTYESRNLNSQSNNYSTCSSTTEIVCAVEHSSSTHTDDYQNSGSDAHNMKCSSDNYACFGMVEDHIIPNHSCENVILDATTKGSSIVTAESQDVNSMLEERQSQCISSYDPPSPEHSNEPSIFQTGIDISICSSKTITEDLEYGESPVMDEGPRKHLSRNLTLEQATNTILFCSSIVHDLAFKAAAVAIEKEQALPSRQLPPLPMTIMEKSIPCLREESGKVSSKHTPRSQKFKKKKLETMPNSPLRELVNENDVIVQQFTPSKVGSPKMLDWERPPKLESKCNCVVM